VKRLRVLVVALALALALIASDGATAATRPSDFMLAFAWRMGSVAPRYHYEWTITAGPGTAGRINYVPGYPGPGVPHYIRTFTISSTALNALYTRLVDANLLRTSWPVVTMPPIGGATQTATIRANGRIYHVPRFVPGGASTLSNATSPLAPLLTQVRAIVPAAVWRSLQAQRAAYVLRRYGPAT
jgi:hypothetical protein